MGSQCNRTSGGERRFRCVGLVHRSSNTQLIRSFPGGIKVAKIAADIRCVINGDLASKVAELFDSLPARPACALSCSIQLYVAADRKQLMASYSA